MVQWTIGADGSNFMGSPIGVEDTAMATIETIYRMAEGHEHDISQSSGSRLSVTSVVAWLDRQLEKRRSRMALLDVSDELLKDIGLSRSDAYREAGRRFWN